MAYTCPACDTPWTMGLVARHSRFTPIACPGCGRRFKFDERQWHRLATPLAFFIAAFVVARLLESIFATAHAFFSVSASLGLVISFVWWMYAMCTKLKFECVDVNGET